MNQQYANGPVYPSQYPQNNRLSYQQPLPAASQANIGTTSAPAGSHTLPPISTADYAPSIGNNDVLGSRAQPLQPSLMTAEPNPMSQQTPTPIYGPTSTTFFTPANSVNAYSQAGGTPQTYKVTSSHYPTLQPHSNQVYHGSSRPSRLPDLRPMPINTLSDGSSAQTPNGTPPGSASRFMDDVGQPIHVVGSQGRRGILPSGPGKPLAISDDAGNGQKNASNPVKDASGKYPCEHCAKTYLHAKHLKRHMLRHTGVRPYTCGLCRDTFSRSDILKRHFQKCSARRGNPTGQSHLTHSRANKKAKAEEEEAAAAAASAIKQDPTPTDSAQPPSAFTQTAFDNTLDLRSLDLEHNAFGDGTRPTITPMSRSSSIKKAKTSRNSSHRGSLGNAPTSAGFDHNMQYSTGHVTPDSITTSGAATPYTYPHETRSNQISPDGPVNRSSSGVSIGNVPTSRPSISSHYSTGSLPHIVGQNGGRGNEMEWQTYQNFHSQEDYGHQPYGAGTLAPHQVKPDLDFSGLPQNLFNFNK